MLSVTRVTALVTALALVVLAPATAGAKRSATTAGPPADYTQTANLTQPRYETEREVIKLPAYDGEELYIEVVRPKAAGRFPVILEASPYHGTLADRDGTRILPEPRNADGKSIGLTGYFAPRGYAVVMMDLRGTGRSQGCLDHLGAKDARDLEQVVEWAAASNWSNGRVGMTGHSYVGSTPSVAAAQRPTGLATIVPSAGLASMYDHQFQAGVPYFLQWAGPIEAYEQLAIERKLPGGDDFGNNMEETGCGLPNSSATAGEDQLSGRYSDWHLARDWSKGATEADIPVFLVHGVNDNAARVASMEWFTKRGGRTGDKLWLGQWDHGSGCCPNRRGIQWTYALHAWFDKQLAQRKVNTGPPVELFMSDGTFEGARTGDRTGWRRAPLAGCAERLAFHPTAESGLDRSAPSEEGSVSFTGDSRGFIAPEETDGATFWSRSRTTWCSPASRRGPGGVGVVAARAPDRQPVRREPGRRVAPDLAVHDQPELRDGLAQRELVTPGERYDMDPPCFAMAHHLREGHRLVLRVTTSDPDKVPMFAEDVQVAVFTGPGAPSAGDVPSTAPRCGHGPRRPARSRPVGAVRGVVDHRRVRRGSADRRRDEPVRRVRRPRGRRQRQGGGRGDQRPAGGHRPVPAAQGGGRVVGRRHRERCVIRPRRREHDDHAPGARHLPDRGAQLGRPAGQHDLAEDDVLQLGG